jgi:hypothetical protein
MADKIKWKRPSVVARDEVRRVVANPRPLLVIWGKIFVPLAALFAIINRSMHGDTSSLPILLRNFVGLSALMLVCSFLMMLLMVWQDRFVVKEYEVGQNGVVELVNRRPRRVYRWNQIESFRIAGDSKLPGIRFLLLKPVGKNWRRWGFDPSEVNEDQLRKVMERRLPS